MSNRPLFPEGVEVHDKDLQLETNSRVGEDNQRLIDESWSTGVASGLAISVNGITNTLIDIQQGHGYAPNGEYIEVAAPILGVALSDYTLNAVNLVTLMYAETAGTPRAHETLGEALNTTILRSFRVRVLTQAQYNALPSTNSNLSQDAQDRALVVATVTAQGVGVALTPANFFRAFDVLAQSNPVDARITTSPITATGIEIVAAQGNANAGVNSSPIYLPPMGNGTLTLVSAGVGSTTSTLQWQAPGDAAGAPVTITGPGQFTLTSGAPSLSNLFVLCSPELFPFAGTYANTVNVSQDIFPPTTGGAVNILSADDRIARLIRGRVSATPTNPTGTRGSDISTVLRVDQGIILGTGMPDNVDHALIPRRTVHRANAGGAFTLIDQFDQGGSNVIERVYTTKSATAASIVFTSNARWDGAAWNKDVSGQLASITILYSAGVTMQTRFAANNAPWTTWDATILQSQQPNLAGMYTDGPLLVGFGIPGSSASVIPSAIAARTYMNVDSAITNRWLIHQETDLNGGVTAGGLRWYVYATAGGLVPAKELVMGAAWNGAQWVADEAVGYVTKITFSTDPITGGPLGLHMRTYNAANGSPFNDGAFVEGWYLSSNPTVSGASTHPNGRIAWGSGFGSGSFTNPNSNVALTNTMCAKATIKAWGLVTLNGAGGPVLVDALNVSSMAVNGGPNGITITLAQAMNNGGLGPCVVATLQSPTASAAGALNALGVTTSFVTASTFDLNVQNDIGIALSPLAPGLTNYAIHFQVLGVQQ